MVLLFYRGARDAPAQRGIFLFPDARRRFRIAGCRTLSRIFCLRRPHFFQQRKKWGKERRQKPVVFGFPFGRFRCGGKRFRRESAMGLPPLPLTWRAGTIGSSIALSDYLLAHLPPLAASAGAARWAAKFGRPAHRRAERGSGSGSYRRVPEPVIARHPCGARERQRGWERKRFLMGLFASYHVRRKGIPKTMGLWRRSFPYFFRC